MTKKTTPEQSKRFGCPYPSFFSARLSLIIAIILLLASIGFLYGKNQELERGSSTLQPTTIPIPTLIPTTTPSKPQPVVDSDPIIDCESSYPNCKGTSIRVRQSQCSKITCCQVGNTWSIYPTTEKCTEAQKNIQPQQVVVPQTAPTANKVPVFLTYGKYTIYCPPQNVDAVKSIDATMTSKSQEWAKQFNDCLELQKSIDPCYKDCDSKMHSASWSCIQSYQSTTPEYESCQDKVTNDFFSCTSGCPNPYTTCQYVYSEQKSMSDQISNLCK